MTSWGDSQLSNLNANLPDLALLTTCPASLFQTDNRGCLPQAVATIPETCSTDVKNHGIHPPQVVEAIPGPFPGGRPPVPIPLTLGGGGSALHWGGSPPLRGRLALLRGGPPPIPDVPRGSPVSRPAPGVLRLWMGPRATPCYFDSLRFAFGSLMQVGPTQASACEAPSEGFPSQHAPSG